MALPAGATLEQVTDALIRSIYEEGLGEEVISIDHESLTRKGKGWGVKFVGSTSDGAQSEQTFTWDGKNVYYQPINPAPEMD